MKVDLTKKEIERLVAWCRVYELYDDSKSALREQKAYLKLADKLRGYY